MMNRLDVILNEAFDAYNSGHFDRAEGLCRDVLSAESTSGDALYLLGLIAYQAGALDPAADLLFRAVKLYPDVINYDLTLASVLHCQGHLNEALSRYQKYPENAQALAQTGLIYLQKNQLDFAESAFQKALSLSPKLPEALFGLAMCHNDFQSLTQIAKTTNLPDAWYYLAKHHRQDKNLKSALTAIDKTGLGQGAYLLEKGLILEDMDRLDEALDFYQQAAQKDPYHADVWTNQANIFRKKSQLSMAEDYYKRALAQDSAHIPAHHNLADLLYHTGRTAEALEHYRAILSRTPDHTDALYNLAVILEKTEEYAEAAGLYVKILLMPDAPRDTGWRLSETLAYLSETDKKLATNFAKGWAKNFPDNPVAQHTLAALTGKKEQNISQYVEALYNDFADSYDQKMEQLKSVALSKLARLLPDKNYTDALDIGCGTGGWGKVFGSHIKHLVGVDLSAGMLEKAKRTKRYEKLLHKNILDYLPQLQKKYDLITAVEVLGYLPDIQDLFQKIGTHLKKDGLFAFSVETPPSDKPILATHGRYLYPSAYIDTCLQQANLSIVSDKEVALRLEGKSIAPGRLIIARLK